MYRVGNAAGKYVATVVEKMRRGAILFCLLALHSPNGELFWVNLPSSVEFAIKPGRHHQDHIAQSTRSVIFGGGQPLGVREEPASIVKMLEDCK